MKISSIEIKKFKRFSDLAITNIPNSIKLVVLLGPNGSGKSSVFDAFNVVATVHKTNSYHFDPKYHLKISDYPEESQTTDITPVLQNIKINFHDNASFPLNELTNETKKSFYFRTAYRNESEFSTNGINNVANVLDDQRHPPRMINIDTRVSDNYQRIVAETVAEIYEPGDDHVTKREIRDRLIGEVRKSMQRVFKDLILTGPGKPMIEGTFFFEKGISKNFRYTNLSAGEKAAFDLLLDFILKTKIFNNTIFCIDEPELHINTALQAKLLAEMYRLIPENCQLWIATHSIGMMREAKRLYYEIPGSIAFLDFDDMDYDNTVQISPVEPDTKFWKKTFRVALDDLADLVAPEQIIFCEGGRAETGAVRNAEFDANCYTKIFSHEYPDTSFISVGGTNDVEKNALLLAPIFRNMFKGITTSVVIDKDDRNEAEMTDLRAQGIKVLSKRDIENFLWNDEILKKMCRKYGQDNKIGDVLLAKETALKNSIARGNPSDDYKSMSGTLYVQIKHILALTGCGSTVQAFCIENLAPLITQDTKTYQQMKNDIFS